MSYTASLKFVPIGKQVEGIIQFYLPNGGTVFDPTYGEQGYQLANILRRQNDTSLDGFLSKKKAKDSGPIYKIIKSDLKLTGDIIASVKALPLKDNIADFTIYDPPFVPRSRSDKRAQEYGIDQKLTVEDIFAFYGSDVIKELARVTKTWLAIRGSDFYDPPNTYNLYLFHDFAMRHIKEARLIPHAVYSYKVTNPKHGIYKLQIQKQKGLFRPIITHSYIALFRKDGEA